MRCASCGFDNPPGFRYCGQCATSLAADSDAAGAADTLPPGAQVSRAYTPRHLAEKVLTSRSALEGERKQVTVLFADVKGSVRLAERLGSEEWHRVLDRLFRILASGVHRFEGTVNQYTGDGMMALFGAPIAHEDHAQRACHAALQISAELGPLAEQVAQRHGVPIGVRMGANSGEVVVGRIGDDLRRDYTAQGPVVGLAARMEELAEPGRIYVTQHVERLVRGFFHLKPLGLREVEGVAAPLAVYELDTAAAARTRLEILGSESRAPLLGRTGVMLTLDKALGQALRGDGLVLGVEGAAGVGKSRLCQEFVDSCRERGVFVCEAHCPSHGRALPHLALRQLLRSFFSLSEEEGEERSRQRILAGCEGLGGERSHAQPMLCDFLGVPDSSAASVDMAERDAELPALVARLFQERAEREPLVILVDDLHWSDAASEASLEKLAGCVPGARMLLLVNFRPEYRPSSRGLPDFLEIGLLPLEREAGLELARRLVGEDPSTARLPELLLERSGGNPLFIEELVRSLVESGRLAGAAAAYTLVAPAEDLEIPETVRAVLAARIDRLGESEKWVLQVASVLGKQFTEPVLASVADLSASDLSQCVRALHAGGLVRPESQYGGTYAFHHPLTREVAYRSLLSDKRRELHAATAEALIAGGEQLGERAALIAHHWDEAGRSYDAERWRRRADFRVTNIVPRGTRPPRTP
jgi:class 3 adenylate cyclase